jgi:hypothetical protein
MARNWTFAIIYKGDDNFAVKAIDVDISQGTR